MNCKLKKPDGQVCGIEIDYDPNTKTAKNVDGSPHTHEKKKSWVKNEYKQLDSELHLLGKISAVESDVDTLKEKIAKLEQGLSDALSAIAKMSFEKASKI